MSFVYCGIFGSSMYETHCVSRIWKRWCRSLSRDWGMPARMPAPSAARRGLHNSRGVWLASPSASLAGPLATSHLPQVTKVKLEQKQKEGIAEARSGRRSLVRFVRQASAACACACKRVPVVS